MKRKVGLFLLAVMVAVSLGAIIVTSLAMYRLASQRYAEEIRKIEASLSDRFAVFQAMLSDQHERITSHMEKVLPAIAQELETTGPGARRSVDRRADGAGAPAYGVQHIYFINRSHVVFQTNLPGDMNLAFPKGPFTEFLDSVFGASRVMSDGIDLSRSPERSRPTATSGPRGKTTSSRPRPTSAAASTRPATAGWQVLLRRIADRPDTLESVGQGARHLSDQPGRHLVADPCRPEARSGPGRAHHQEPSRGDQQRRWPLSHHLQRRTDGVGDPARPSGDRQARDPQDHLRRRAGARGRHPGLPELDDRAGAADAGGVLDRLAAAAEAAARSPVQPARRGRRHRPGRPQPGDRQHRPARRDRPARHELRRHARRGAQDHHRPQGHQHLDRALRAAGLPGDRRQAVDRRGRAGRQQAPEHDDPVLRHQELHDPVGEP